MSKKHSWKEKYKLVRETYIPLWNAALNFIGENYGEKAVDKYLDDYMSNVTNLYLPTNKKMIEKQGVKGILKTLIPHLDVCGFEVRVDKAERDEVVFTVLKCSSQTLLKEKNQDSKYYCRHCNITSKFYRQLGITSEAKKTSDTTCVRTFKKLNTN